MLGEAAEPFMAAYGVKPGGNWEGRSILALQEAAPLVGTLDDRQALALARARLFGAREAMEGPTVGFNHAVAFAVVSNHLESFYGSYSSTVL